MKSVLECSWNREIPVEWIGENNAPQYHIVGMKEAALISEKERERERNLRHMYKTFQGLLQFHSMILNPNSRSFRASPRLCLCNTYQVAYKSCCLFSSLNYWCWSSIRFPFRATFLIIPLQRLWFGTKWMILFQ